ncbi:MAG: DUF4190 domain-containing protein [Kofleriaceae bacterium]
MSNPYQFTQGEPDRAAGGAAPPPSGNGMAVAGLVLGICATVLFWVPLLNWVLGILGIVFGGLGISRSKASGKGKGMATAGLILGILGFVAGIAFVAYAWSQAKKEIRYEFRRNSAAPAAIIQRG